MSIFFASMAQNFSERASHAVSRGSVAALIPHEKSAKLIQPLKENTDKSARNYTGADKGTRIDYLRLRGLAKVLEDEATFSPLEGGCTPAELRRHLFAHGPVFATPDIFHPQSREDVLATVAVDLASSVEQVEALFFADRPEEYVLTHPGPTWTPLTLLRRYNLELARGVLYRATILWIEIYDNFKDIWRYLKLFKIMFWCDPQDAQRAGTLQENTAIS